MYPTPWFGQREHSLSHANTFRTRWGADGDSRTASASTDGSAPALWRQAMPAQSHDPQSLVRMVQEQGKPWRPGETSVSRLDERQKLLRLGARSELVQDFERRASLQ